MVSIRNVDHKIQILQQHQDAVERFLALYDLNRIMTKGNPTVAEAIHVLTVFEKVAKEDRDLNVRAWSRYFVRRINGQIPENPKPFLPRQWQLLIVET